MSQQKKLEGYIYPEDEVAIAALDLIEYKHPAEEIISNFTFAARLEEEVLTLRFQPYSAQCNSAYHAIHSSGKRPLSVIGVHVLHCTQSTGRALGVARYFTEESAGGSTQYVNDDNECYRCLRDDQIPWGAPGANYVGLHYEQVGMVSWGKYVWSRNHRRTINRTAWKVARDCKRYGNKPRWLTVEQLRQVRADILAGKTVSGGITDHATCTKAFGGDHTDPGPNYPRKLFMSLVKTFYVAIKIARIA